MNKKEIIFLVEDYSSSKVDWKKYAYEEGAKLGITIEYKDGEVWKSVVDGKNIGNGFFKQFAPVRAKEFRLNILQAKSGGVEIKEFQLFYDE